MKINEIKLATNDLNQTVSFYTQTLGLTTAKQTDKHVSLHAGTSILTFTQDNTCTTPIYHFAFNIPHNQLPDAIKWLEKRTPILPVTAESNIAEFSTWNANAIYFTDNNGNLLEFIARHDLNNNSNTPFSAASIQCISEIGIAVPNVPAYTAQLNLNYFAKQPPQEKFAALGDDEGLLIIAEENRNWFPTNIPAGRFPLEIHFDDKQLVIPAQ
jgi:catechol-2,3-dioxygenase